jgi:hypothetical protein
MDRASGATEHADRTDLKVAVGDLIAQALIAEALSDGHANEPCDTPAGLDEKEGILWRSRLRDGRFLNDLGLCRHCQIIEAGSDESLSYHKPYQDLIHLKRMSLLGCYSCRELFEKIFRVPRGAGSFSFRADLGSVDQNIVVYEFHGLKLHFEVFTTESLWYWAKRESAS